MKSFIIFLILILVGLGVYFAVNKSKTGDQNDKTGTSSSSSQESLKVVDITGHNFAFSMNEIRVKKGDKVRINFTNTDGFHNWSVDEFSAKTERVQAGNSASVEFTADKPGTYEYYCDVGNHRQMGMKGNLVVEE